MPDQPLPDQPLPDQPNRPPRWLLSTEELRAVEDDPLQIARWNLVVGQLRSEDLPGIATDALVRGLDSPSLRELAGQDPSDVRDSRDLFVSALSELGMGIPDADEVTWRLVRHICEAILAGRVTPEYGAALIGQMYFRLVTEEGDLRIFLGLTSQLEDYPDDREAFERDVKVAAQDLLSRDAPRRWLRLMASTDNSPLSRQGRRGSALVMATDEPIGLGLKTDLDHWNATYRSVAAGWPKEGGFASREAAEEFAAAGRLLARRLQSELGPNYHIEYRQVATRPPGLMVSGSGTGEAPPSDAR